VSSERWEISLNHVLDLFFNETGGVCTPTSVLLNCKKGSGYKRETSKTKGKSSRNKEGKKENEG
jgi:hypothetical protein